jgi:hypothetical protein
MKNTYFNTKTKINKSLNLKTMKNNYVKNTLKCAVAAVFMMAIGTANAQTGNADNANVEKTALNGASVKLIDNKGTIKYLQTNNGITSITSTTSGSATTTTWQLGGALVDATTITTTDDESFTIDGVGFNLKETTVNNGIAATTTTSGVALSDGTVTGYTLLVRDEDTGRIKKMLATELVSAIRVDYSQITDNLTASQDITVTGLPALVGPSQLGKLFVFRNGAKLRALVDFTVTADKISTILPTLPMYSGDIVEIQYIK